MCVCFATLCGTAKYGQSHMQMDSGKLVMQPKTDVGSELSLTSFDVNYPGLAAVRVGCVLTIDFAPPTSELLRCFSA